MDASPQRRCTVRASCFVHCASGFAGVDSRIHCETLYPVYGTIQMFSAVAGRYYGPPRRLVGAGDRWQP